MTQAVVIERLKRMLPNFPIKKAWLFGSYATGDFTDESDVDLLVDYDKDEDFSLFTIGKIISSLSEGLGRRVDAVEDGHLLAFAQKHADQTKILIYERNA